MVLTEQKRNYLEKLSTKEGVISALAFDQRGALKRSWLSIKTQNQQWLKMERIERSWWLKN